MNILIYLEGEQLDYCKEHNEVEDLVNDIESTIRGLISLGIYPQVHTGISGDIYIVTIMNIMYDKSNISYTVY